MEKVGWTLVFSELLRDPPRQEHTMSEDKAQTIPKSFFIMASCLSVEQNCVLCVKSRQQHLCIRLLRQLSYQNHKKQFRKYSINDCYIVLSINLRLNDRVGEGRLTTG